jgi:hypothetical protein
VHIPSVAESRIAADVLARLPASPSPAPPWESLVAAVVWLQRATPSARGALPPAIGRGAPAAPLAAGALVDYRSGPVGPYREVFAGPLLVGGGAPRLHVPFIAVDSLESLAAGRRNWALPKALATFDGAVGEPGRTRATGEGWALQTTATARTRAVPLVGVLGCDQVWPDGAVRRFTVRVRGRARLATVRVEHPVASGLAAWLTPGRHPGLLLTGRQTVTPPA